MRFKKTEGPQNDASPERWRSDPASAQLPRERLKKYEASNRNSRVLMKKVKPISKQEL